MQVRRMPPGTARAEGHCTGTGKENGLHCGKPLLSLVAHQDSDLEPKDHEATKLSFSKNGLSAVFFPKQFV